MQGGGGTDLWNPLSGHWDRLHKLGGGSCIVGSLSMVGRKIMDLIPMLVLSHTMLGTLLTICLKFSGTVHHVPGTLDYGTS